MALENNKAALCKTQLVSQNTDYYAKYGTWKTTLQVENSRSKSLEDSKAVLKQKLRTFQSECHNLKEELEGQRQLNETLMLENDNIEHKWRALVTDYEHKFQACKNELRRQSITNMAALEQNQLNREGENDYNSSVDYQREVDARVEKEDSVMLREGDESEGEQLLTASNGEYQQTKITNGADTGLDVASAVADKENTELQVEMISVKDKNAELHSYCESLSKNQKMLVRALEEKESEVARVRAAAEEKERQNAALKCELSEALAKSSELDKSLSNVQDENKKLKSELQSLQNRFSELENSNKELNNNDAARERKEAAAADPSERNAELKTAAESTEGVLLRKKDSKSRTAPDFYRHSITVGSLPRPFMDFSSYSAPDRKKSFSGDNSHDDAGTPSFLQRRVNASYLNAFKPRPFSHRPVNFTLGREGSKEEQKEAVPRKDSTAKERDTAESKSHEFRDDSQAIKGQDVHPNASGELHSVQETAQPSGLHSDVTASVDKVDMVDKGGKAKLQYESDEDDEAMALNARKEDVNALVNLWNTKTEVTDV